MKAALLLLNLQEDHAPPEELVAAANALAAGAEVVVAAREWHATDHVSFASNHPGRVPGEVILHSGQELVLGAAHCIQNTEGAAFARGLNQRAIEHIVNMGESSDVDDASAFFDAGYRRPTPLGELLTSLEVELVYLLGQPGMRSFQATASDAVRMGFQLSIVGTGGTPVVSVSEAMQALRGARSRNG